MKGWNTAPERQLDPRRGANAVANAAMRWPEDTPSAVVLFLPVVVFEFLERRPVPLRAAFEAAVLATARRRLRERGRFCRLECLSVQSGDGWRAELRPISTTTAAPETKRAPVADSYFFVVPNPKGAIYLPFGNAPPRSPDDDEHEEHHASIDLLLARLKTLTPVAKSDPAAWRAGEERLFGEHRVLLIRVARLLDVPPTTPAT